MSVASSFEWTPGRMDKFHATRHLTQSQAAKIIGCTLGTLAGKRKRMADAEVQVVDPDDWEHRLRETWEQRKARRKREAMRNHTLVTEISN